MAPDSVAASDAGPITLALIEDNRLLRDGLTALIDLQSGMRVLWGSSDATEARLLLAKAKPDVFLVDAGLATGDSLRLTAELRAEMPASRVILMGLLPHQDDVAEYVRAGASGFALKDATVEDLLATIRTVAAGGEVLPSRLITSLFSHLAAHAHEADSIRHRDGINVTDREREVVGLLVDGMSNREIAAKLDIAVHTVKSHVHNILEKLALHSRLEIVALVRERSGGKKGTR